jgi:hypothetical protein
VFGYPDGFVPKCGIFWVFGENASPAVLVSHPVVWRLALTPQFRYHGYGHKRKENKRDYFGAKDDVRTPDTLSLRRR